MSSASDSLFAGAALGISVANVAYSYRRLSMLADLINDLTDILRSMNGTTATIHERQSSLDDNYQKLHQYVTDEIEDIRGQLPSIEC